MATKSWKSFVCRPVNIILSPREIAAQKMPKGRSLRPMKTQSNVITPRVENVGPTKMWRTIEASQKGPEPAIKYPPNVVVKRAAQSAASIRGNVTLDWTPSKTGKKPRVKMSYLRRMGSTHSSGGSSAKSFRTRWMKRERAFRCVDGTPVFIEGQGPPVANASEAAYRLEMPRNQRMERSLGCLSMASDVSRLIQEGLMPVNDTLLDRLNVSKTSVSNVEAKKHVQQHLKKLTKLPSPTLVPTVMPEMPRRNERCVAEAGVVQQRQYLKSNIRFGADTRLKANKLSDTLQQLPSGSGDFADKHAAKSYEQMLQQRKRASNRNESNERMDDLYLSAEDEPGRWQEQEQQMRTMYASTTGTRRATSRLDGPVSQHIKSFAANQPVRMFASSAFNLETVRKNANRLATARVVHKDTSGIVTTTTTTAPPKRPPHNVVVDVVATEPRPQLPVLDRRTIAGNLMPVIRRTTTANTSKAIRRNSTAVASASKSVRTARSTATPRPRNQKFVTVPKRTHAPPQGPLRNSLASTSTTEPSITEANSTVSKKKTKLRTTEKFIQNRKLRVTRRPQQVAGRYATAPQRSSIRDKFEDTVNELEIHHSRFGKSGKPVRNTPTTSKSTGALGTSDKKDVKTPIKSFRKLTAVGPVTTKPAKKYKVKPNIQAHFINSAAIVGTKVSAAPKVQAKEKPSGEGPKSDSKHYREDTVKTELAAVVDSRVNSPAVGGANPSQVARSSTYLACVELYPNRGGSRAKRY